MPTVQHQPQQHSSTPDTFPPADSPMPTRKPSIPRRRHVAPPTHLQTLCPTGDPIVALAFSPTAHFLAAALQHGPIHVLSVAPCTPGSAAPPLYPHSTRVLDGHLSDVLSLAFSPDGALLASAAMDRDVRLWHPARTNACLRVLRHADMATSVAFAPTALSTSSSPRSSSGLTDPWPDLSDPSAPTRSLSGFAECGASDEQPPAVLLSTCCDGRARAWDARSGNLLNAADSGHVLTAVHYVSASTAALATYDGRVLSWRRPPDASRLLGGVCDASAREHSAVFDPLRGDDAPAMRRTRHRMHPARWLRRGRARGARGVTLAVAQGEVGPSCEYKRVSVAVSGSELSLMRDGAPVARARLCSDGGGWLWRAGGRKRGSGSDGVSQSAGARCTGLSDDGRFALVGAAARGGVRLADLRGLLASDLRDGAQKTRAVRARAEVITLRVLGRGVETSCAAIAPTAVRKRCGRGGSGPDVAMIAVAGDDGSLTIVEQRLPTEKV